MQTKVMIISRQAYWLSRATSALQEIHDTPVEVCVADHYDVPSLKTKIHDLCPSLLVLGCASFEAAEEELVGQLLAPPTRWLILSGQVQMGTMRKLILSGVYDIAERPYDPASIAQIIRLALPGIMPMQPVCADASVGSSTLNSR